MQNYHNNYRPAKEKVKKMFRGLRKQGVLARMNFMCCQGCGGYELTTQAKKKSNVKGYVFYHQQSNWRFQDTGKVCLYYAGYGGTDAMTIARMVVDEARTQGLKVSWDGTDDKTIIVH
jgi:hypothetical protein